MKSIDFSQLKGRRVGANINATAVKDWPYLLATLRRWQSRFNLVMDGINRAVEVSEINPNSVTSARFYHPDDTEYWKRNSERDALNFMIHKGAHPRRNVVYEVDCEPSTHDDLLGWFNWTITLARMCRDEKLNYITAIADAKTIEKTDVDSGLWDGMIAEWHLNPYFYRGHHGYAYLNAQAPYMAGYPSNMFDGERMHPDRWPTSVPHKRKIDGRLPDNWHLWRPDWLNIRSNKLGYGDLPAFWSEGVYDNMDDVANMVLPPITGNQSIKEWIKRFNNGVDVKGIPSLRGYWKHILPQFDFEELAYRHIEWIEAMTPPEYVGISLFTWSENEDWVTFDIQELYDLHKHMEQLPIREGISSMASTPLIETPTEFARFMIETTDAGKGLRVRSQPSLSGIVYGSIPAGKIEARVHIPSPDIKANGYSWVYVKIESPSTTLNGWAAAKKLSPETVYLTVGPHPLESGEVPVVDPGDSDPPTTPPDEPDTEPDDPPVEDPTEPEPPIYGPVVVVTDLDNINDETRSNLARYAAANVIALLDLSVHHITALEIIEFAKTRAQERAEELLAESNKASSPETV